MLAFVSQRLHLTSDGIAREETMKIIPLLMLLLVISGGAHAAPATDKPGAWWGHSPSNHHGKAVRPHTGRRNLSTHPERRRKISKY